MVSMTEKEHVQRMLIKAVQNLQADLDTHKAGDAADTLACVQALEILVKLGAFKLPLSTLTAHRDRP